uniref:ATP citrate synthase n=1 Tax=Macrostomum lignano TaxID=282301 RepID=A0A1I8FK23_9PLAT
MVCPAPPVALRKRRYSIRAQSASSWGMQQRSVQKLLATLTFVCSRREPSVVVAIRQSQPEVLLGATTRSSFLSTSQMSDAMRKHPRTRALWLTLLRCARLRQYLGGVAPRASRENLSRRLALRAAEKSVTVIGPATVGGHQARLPSRSATRRHDGQHLELQAVQARLRGLPQQYHRLNADGVLEGVAIGGDRYPGSTFLDHLLRYQADPGAQMLVVLGEVGGQEEWRIADALRDGRIHQTNGGLETASAKNAALAAAALTWARQFGCVYEDLVGRGVIVPKEEPAPPTVPMDYSWARELGLIRKPSSFMTSICDERGQELLYAGPGANHRDHQSRLWHWRPDHGPAVSGAHNTIVCARAGKDLVSCLTSGLLTIGDRFGGALDGAAKQFSHGVDTGLIPMEFVNEIAQARRTDHGHWASG